MCPVCERLKKGLISRIATEENYGDEYTVEVLKDLLELIE